jgi:hypothetical protein
MKYEKIFNELHKNVVRFEAYKEREKLCKEYSFAVPNQEAIDEICKYSPIIEVGAGTGYWAFLVSKNGGDIIASDISEIGRNKYKFSAQYYEIIKEDHTIAAKYPDRALLLVWPPYNKPMAYDALMAYQGDIVIYIGEDYGGCCADDKFHQELMNNWEIVNDISIPQWSGIHDYLTVYKRKTELKEK